MDTRACHFCLHNILNSVFLFVDDASTMSFQTGNPLFADDGIMGNPRR